MKNFRYELHCHTRESSKCGRIPARDVVKRHRDAGYQGIVITDHFNEENFQLSPMKSWGKRVDRFLKGFRLAAEEGRRWDMDVFWGLELRFTGNDNDYLVYGMTEELVKSSPYLNRTDIFQFMSFLGNRDDVLVYQAHPFRAGCKLVDPLVVQGLETYNGNPRHDSRNDLAAEVVQQKGLLALSGSDFHRPEDLATGGILLPRRIRTLSELVENLKILGPENLVTDKFLPSVKT